MEQRPIDANALRERLLVLRCNITDVQCISDIFDICLTEVSNAPTVNTVSIEKRYFIKGFKEGCEYGKKCYERPQAEWIPVSERLPEENVCDDGYHEPSKWVLVQARNGYMYTTRYWTRDKKNVWTDLDYPDDIVAWQPLPERYRKEGEEE